MKNVQNKVNQLMTKQIKKNHSVIDNALIKPIDDEYQFSTNGVYFFCSKMGGGKTYQVMKHIMITERLYRNEPLYDTIIFTSTSGSLDKTVTSLQPQVRTKIQYVPDSSLMPMLEKHIKNKMKFYAVMEFINSGGEEVNELMARLIKKYHFVKIIKGKNVYDMRRIIQYAQMKCQKYHFNTYPSNTLLVLDDFAGHPLLKKPDSPLARMMTKTRHYHLTVIIIAQTWRFINLNLKRLCTDIVIWKGFSEEDFMNMIKQTPSSQNWKVLWESYKSLESPHSKMILHCVTDNVEFEE